MPKFSTTNSLRLFWLSEHDFEKKKNTSSPFICQNIFLVASFTDVCGQRTKAPTISWWHSSADGARQRHEEQELRHRLWWNLEQNKTDRMERIDRDKSSGRKTKGENINRQRPTYFVYSVFQIWLWPSGFLFFRTLLSARFSMPFKIDLSRWETNKKMKKRGAWSVNWKRSWLLPLIHHFIHHCIRHCHHRKWEFKIPLIIHPSMSLFRSSCNKPRRNALPKNKKKWNTLDTSLTSLIFSTLNCFCWVKKRGRNSHDTWKNSQMVSIGIVTDLHPATTTSHNFVSSHQERAFKKKSRTRWPNQMNSKLPSTWEICIHQCPQHGHRAWGHWSSFDNTPSGCDTLAASHDIVVILTTDWLQRRLLWTTPSTNLMEYHNLGFQLHSHSSPDFVRTEISAHLQQRPRERFGSWKGQDRLPQDLQACCTLWLRMRGSWRVFAFNNSPKNHVVSRDQRPPTSPAKTTSLALPRGLTNSGYVCSFLLPSNAAPINRADVPSPPNNGNHRRSPTVGHLQDLDRQINVPDHVLLRDKYSHSLPLHRETSSSQDPFPIANCSVALMMDKQSAQLARNCAILVLDALLNGVVAQLGCNSQEVTQTGSLSLIVDLNELLFLFGVDLFRENMLHLLQQNEPTWKSGTDGILRLRVSCFWNDFSNWALTKPKGLPKSQNFVGWEDFTCWICNLPNHFAGFRSVGFQTWVFLPLQCTNMFFWRIRRLPIWDTHSHGIQMEIAMVGPRCRSNGGERNGTVLHATRSIRQWRSLIECIALGQVHDLHESVAHSNGNTLLPRTPASRWSPSKISWRPKSNENPRRLRQLGTPPILVWLAQCCLHGNISNPVAVNVCHLGVHAIRPTFAGCASWHSAKPSVMCRGWHSETVLRNVRKETRNLIWSISKDAAGSMWNSSATINFQPHMTRISQCRLSYTGHVNAANLVRRLRIASILTTSCNARTCPSRRSLSPFALNFVTVPTKIKVRERPSSWWCQNRICWPRTQNRTRHAPIEKKWQVLNHPTLMRTTSSNILPTSSTASPLDMVPHKFGINFNMHALTKCSKFLHCSCTNITHLSPWNLLWPIGGCPFTRSCMLGTVLRFTEFPNDASPPPSTFRSLLPEPSRLASPPTQNLSDGASPSVEPLLLRTSFRGVSNPARHDSGHEQNVKSWDVSPEFRYQPSFSWFQTSFQWLAFMMLKL